MIEQSDECMYKTQYYMSGKIINNLGKVIEQYFNFSIRWCMYEWM